MARESASVCVYPVYRVSHRVMFESSHHVYSLYRYLLVSVSKSIGESWLCLVEGELFIELASLGASVEKGGDKVIS